MFGDNALSCACVFECHKWFYNCREKAEYNERAVRSVTASTEGKVESQN